jgi:hypothetical protein
MIMQTNSRAIVEIIASKSPEIMATIKVNGCMFLHPLPRSFKNRTVNSSLILLKKHAKIVLSQQQPEVSAKLTFKAFHLIDVVLKKSSMQA